MENANNDAFYEDETPRSLFLQNKGAGWNRREMLYLFGAGILILVILVISLWPKNKAEPRLASTASSGTISAGGLRFDAIDQRLSEIENRLNRHPQSAGEIGPAGSHAARSLANSERIEQIIARLDAIDRRIDEMRKASTSGSVVRAASEPVQQAVPKTNSQTSVQGARYYDVKKGDTPYSIAKQHGLALQALLDLNRMNSKSVIRPGDRIRIK